MRKAHPGALVVVACALGAPSWPGAAVALEPEQVLGPFAQKKERHAHFAETKFLAILDSPVHSSGTLAFVPPSRMEKNTLEPKAERLVLDGNALSVRRDGKEMTLDLSSHPAALSFVEAIRAVLMGDIALLRHQYAITVQGDALAWNLRLVPQDRRLSDIVREIRIGGAGGEVLRIEYLQRDGDRSEMQIVPDGPDPVR